MKNELRLEQIAQRIGGTLLDMDRWDDSIEEILKDESKITTERQGKVLLIDGHRELAYIILCNTLYQISYRWYSPFRFTRWEHCYSETAFGKEQEYFAQCMEDVDGWEELPGTKELEEAGFMVGSFEGF